MGRDTCRCQAGDAAATSPSGLDPDPRRKDEPMTSLSALHPVTLHSGDLDAWRRDGYLHVVGAFTAAQIAEISGWVDDIAGRPNGDCGLMQHYEVTEFGPQIARSEYLLEHHEGLRSLLTSGAIPEFGGRLVGEPIVLYKEKINYKLSGGAGFQPHQDAPAYPHIDNHLTCMIAVDDSTVENGCLEVVPGLHGGPLREDGDGCIHPDVTATFDWVPLEMAAGDILWFHSKTPHRSGPNRSDRTRRAFFLTYNAASEGDRRERYYADKRAYFADSAAGSARLSFVGGFDGVSPTERQLREIGAVGGEASDPPAVADLPTWRRIDDVGDLAEAICRLYDARGGSNYDEAVSQTVHALQSADLAAASGAPDELVAASLLHDIGHLLLGEWEERDDFLERDLHHEEVAARFLSNWFGPAITEPIRLHVDAKRYLCAVEPGYVDELSPSSVRSLMVQGGPMDADELAAFARLDHVAAAIALRRWDDEAKQPDLPVGAIRDHVGLLAGLAVLAPTDRGAEQRAGRDARHPV
jgi:2-aminoethylphosphonate dioxygenase